MNAWNTCTYVITYIHVYVCLYQCIIQDEDRVREGIHVQHILLTHIIMYVCTMCASTVQLA